MTPFHSDPWLDIYAGDCRDVLPMLPSESVHCVVTSPPYWGLRDYGTAQWSGGDAECDHLSAEARPRSERPNVTGAGIGKGGPSFEAQDYASRVYRDTCRKCGAIRQDSQLGLEPTPEEYVANMVAVFREVRRVLRSDGTLWLNLGDSYSSDAKGTGGDGTRSGLRRDGRAEESRVRSARLSVANQSFEGRRVKTGLKPKDLVGIPWRVAFALQADGWYLRSDIIWSKPNPMPESVTDRPTKSHEYLFLLTKSPRYYFDGEAVRLPVSPNWTHGAGAPMPELGDHRPTDGARGHQAKRVYEVAKGANIRSVWTIATAPYPGAHFAVFPPKLVEPCIKAGTSEKGVCPECGAPWRRVVERARMLDHETYRDGKTMDGPYAKQAAIRSGILPTVTTTGWQPSCAHDAAPVPASLLDPFAGSGTVGMVAQRLSRRAVLIDLNPSYLEQQLRRNAALPLGLVG